MLARSVHAHYALPHIFVSDQHLKVMPCISDTGEFVQLAALGVGQT